MSISNNKNDDTALKQERRYIGRFGEGIDHPRDFCEGSSEDARVSGSPKRWKGVMVEHILKLFGYREKTVGIHEAIRNACLLNVEVEERLNKVKATLNGEYGWFVEEDVKSGSTSE